MKRKVIPLSDSGNTSDEDLRQLERSAFLEMIPVPALLYARNTDHLLLANQSFYELSTISPAALPRLSLASVFVDSPDTNPTDKTPNPTRLVSSSRQFISGDLHIQSISPTNQTVILVFTPAKEIAETSTNDYKREYKADVLNRLSKICSQNSSEGVFLETMDAVGQLINCEHIAGYQLSSDDPKTFQKLQRPDERKTEAFPASISAATLSDLSQSLLWQSEHEPLHPLHHHARAESWLYFLCLPFIFGDKIQGLLLAGSSTPPPGSDKLQALTTMADISAATLNQLTRKEVALRKVNNIQTVLRVDNKIRENLSEGIIVLTPDLQILAMNPSAENMLGYAASEVFQKNIELILIGNENLSKLYRAAQLMTSTFAGKNLTINNRQGQAFPVQLLCVPVVNDHYLQNIVLFLRDLSQTEQIRQHSQQLEQRAFLGEVTAIFSHEIKNPINSLFTGLQMLNRQLPSEDSLNRRRVASLLDDCRHIIHLLDSTLTFSKPSEYHIAPVNLGDMLPNLLERWAPRMTHLGIHYQFQADPPDPIVQADHQALEQVFINLITNAIDAMEKDGGSLNIKIQALKGDKVKAQYEVLISDTGGGIPEKIISHIFEPFLTTKANGTGLGLPICKRIISAFKGSITVETYPGGSTFHILLPMDL